MTSQTVSIRIPKNELSEIDRLADILEVDRATIIKRCVTVGVGGLLNFEKSGEPFNWPRKGQMALSILPDSVLCDLERRQDEEQMAAEMPDCGD